MSASYLDLYLVIDNRERLNTKLWKMEIKVLANFLSLFLRSPLKNYVSYAYRNKSESSRAHFVRIGIPIVCWSNRPVSAIILYRKTCIAKRGYSLSFRSFRFLYYMCWPLVPEWSEFRHWHCLEYTYYWNLQFLYNVMINSIRTRRMVSSPCSTCRMRCITQNNGQSPARYATEIIFIMYA
jgi:hypothetical protein